METNTQDSDDLSVLNYVIQNYHKFILLILVFLIIYFVDYISNINAVIYGSPQIPNVLNNSINIKKPRKNKK